MCVWGWIQNICRVKQRNYMHINLPAMTAPYQRSTLLSIAESVPSHFCFFFLLLFRLLLLWLLFLFYYYWRELFLCYLTYIYIFVIICTHTICNDKFSSIVYFSLSLSSISFLSHRYHRNHVASFVVPQYCSFVGYVLDSPHKCRHKYTSKHTNTYYTHSIGLQIY